MYLGIAASVLTNVMGNGVCRSEGLLKRHSLQFSRSSEAPGFLNCGRAHACIGNWSQPPQSSAWSMPCCCASCLISMQTLWFGSQKFDPTALMRHFHFPIFWIMATTSTHSNPFPQITKNIDTTVAIVFRCHEVLGYDSCKAIVIERRSSKPPAILGKDVRIVQCTTETDRLHNS